jgi:chemotaxis protein methyltransferase CheR
MTISEADFGYVRDLVRRRSAIVIEPGKEYLVESRLSGVARQEGFRSLERLVAELKATPAGGLHRKVIDAMTTNETTFFRDLHPFEGLRLEILPELIAARAGERRLSIWCAACSTGQEPFSIAMLIREHFPMLAGWSVRILATDISQDVLARARLGRFSQLEVNRGLPASSLVKHFRKEGSEWQIAETILQMVEFRELNLIDDWPGLPAMDLVLMRNVLIYFDVPTKREILGRVRRVLRPDGRLFLGGAETTMNLDDAYQRVSAGKAACYRPTG